MDDVARAELAVMQAARDVCDYTFGLAAGVTTPAAPGDRIREARRVGILRLTLLDRAVILELVSGTSWEEAGVALMLPASEVIARYGPVLNKWRADLAAGNVHATIHFDATGLPTDRTAADTAITLDQWLDRHEAWLMRHPEPWDTPGPPLASRFTTS